MRGTLPFLRIAVALSLLSSCILNGQDFLSPTQMKGTHDKEIWTGAVIAQHDGSTTFNSEFWMAGVRFGRVLTAPHGPGWLRGTLQWNFDVIPVFVAMNLQSAYGAELDPIVGRWNFSHSGRTTPYFEMAGGVVWTTEKIPPGYTSRFNIVPKFGFGWQFFNQAERAMDVGINAWHLSNAWTASRNPSSNGIQLTVGYHWFAPRKSTRATSNPSGGETGGRK